MPLPSPGTLQPRSPRSSRRRRTSIYGKQQGACHLSPVTQRRLSQQLSLPAPPPTDPKPVSCFSKLLACCTAKIVYNRSSPHLLPARRQAQPKKCLLLDLDDTLIRSTLRLFNPADESAAAVPTRSDSFQVQFPYGGQQFEADIKVRPGCQQIIQKLAPHFELCIFTASVKAYCDKVLDVIDPDHHISHRLYREHCTPEGDIFYKDLSKLGRDLDQCALLDDRSESYGLQPENGIPISAWDGDTDDCELHLALQLLTSIAHEESLVASLAVYDNELGWNRLSCEGQEPSPSIRGTNGQSSPTQSPSGISIGIAPLEVRHKELKPEDEALNEVFMTHTWEAEGPLGLVVSRTAAGIGARVSKITDLRWPKEIEHLMIESIDDDVTFQMPYDQVLCKLQDSPRPVTLSFTNMIPQRAHCEDTDYSESCISRNNSVESELETIQAQPIVEPPL